MNFELAQYKNNSQLEKGAQNQFMESEGSIISTESASNRKYFRQQSSTDGASKMDIQERNRKNQQAQWKTYLKVGQMTANPKHVVPFIIDRILIDELVKSE